jgi:hypothetical protein
MAKFVPPPVPYTVYKELLRRYNALYALHFANAEANELPGLKHMTKLQRNKLKFPQAYAKLKAKLGWRLANELFRHIAEEPRG